MININISFKKYLKNIILTNNKINKYYINKFPNSKYNLDDILDGILFILKTGISWRDSTSMINWNSLYFHFKRFVDNDIFKKMFLKLRKKYIDSCDEKHLNIQIVDSSFIMNKFGKDNIARNKFFKNKNCNKISLITDINGIPLSVLVNTGNVHDLSFIDKHMKDIVIINKKNKTSHILLADKAYESKKVRNDIINYNYTLMIPKKSNMKINYPFDKNIYKKRLFVEHTFQKLKIFRRIAIRYDSLLKNYKAFLFLGVSSLIFKNIKHF